MNISNQIPVAVEAALRGESIFKDIRFAITGDAISDCMAGIRAVCDDSKLSARQVQFLMEAYVKLYKDAADDNERRISEAKRLGSQTVPGAITSWPPNNSVCNGLHDKTQNQIDAGRSLPVLQDLDQQTKRAT